MFIVLYGINNLGKSTQAKLLVERLQKEGYKAEYVKYPIYDLEPSGPMLNDYLRNGNDHLLLPREAQLLYVLNRTQYEPVLKAKLEEGVHIVAEDYTGTGMAWGAGAGIEKNFLTRINNHLLKEDAAFLFEGERFIDATETNHKHETNQELLKKVEIAHQELGHNLGWIPVNANRPPEVIHHELWTKIQRYVS